MAGKGSGGAKGALYTFITLIILGGAGLAWMHINNIKGPEGVYDYFHSWSNHIEKCDNKLHWRCKTNLNVPNDGSSSTGLDSKPLKADKDVNISPPSLQDAKNKINIAAPSIANSKNLLSKALDKATTGNPAKVNYQRSEWRHWTGEPCNTRKVILMQQGSNVKTNKTSNSCVIVSGTWISPYDGKKFTDPNKMDIDHVIPLAYAAAHGGESWSSAKKEQFANDTSQLYAVSANANRSKGDKGPSQYMPDSGFECQYAKTWIATSTKYGVSLTQADKKALSSALNSCDK